MKMNMEKYDRVVWRINGSLLLLACIGAILMMLVVGYKLASELFGRHQVHDIVNVDENTKKEEFLRIGYFQYLKGTEFILIPLSSEQTYSASYYSKSSHSRARNYMIFDSKNKSSYWIWKSNESLILDETKIYDQISEEKTQKTRGMVFEFVEKNSNADSVLDENDQKSVHYHDLASKETISILNQVDRIVGIQQSASDEVLFFYSRSGKSYFKSLNTSSFVISNEKEILLPPAT